MLMKDLFNSKTKIASFVLGMFFLMVLPPFYTSYWVSLLTQMLIFAVLAMSLDVLMGYTGPVFLRARGILRGRRVRDRHSDDPLSHGFFCPACSAGLPFPS